MFLTLAPGGRLRFQNASGTELADQFEVVSECRRELYKGFFIEIGRTHRHASYSQSVLILKFRVWDPPRRLSVSEVTLAQLQP